jgi:pentatricopeptide repeat protein
MGPPEEAYLALVQGYGQAGDLSKVLTAIRRFMSLGGRPHRRMLDAVVKMCLNRGDYTAAYKVVRAAVSVGRVVQERVGHLCFTGCCV